MCTGDDDAGVICQSKEYCIMLYVVYIFVGSWYYSASELYDR